MIDWNDSVAVGAQIHSFARELWPLPRSLSGAGLRDTLKAIRRLNPSMQLIEVASGTSVLDWIVPDEWQVREAWIETPSGDRICEFSENNLHLLGYSEAVNCELSLSELQMHLYSLPEQPDAIPYVTSYYQRRWGFCLSQLQRDALQEGTYRVHTDARHFSGSITLGELLIPGESSNEVLLSSYCCHPSMANNELSGPALLAYLGSWLSQLPRRRLSYRLIFVPEMIGSIAYIARRLEQLRSQTIAGFNVSCVGDERVYSFLPSRAGNTLADQVALHVLSHTDAKFIRWNWRDRGSDESNYCAPGIDLPVVSMMRSKYGSYPEYHTSLDTLETVVTERGLGQSFLLYQRAILALEMNCTPRALVLGEPQLGRRGLYPSISQKGSSADVRTMLDLISYADGAHDLLSIADQCEVPIWILAPIVERLVDAGVLAV